ncbi:hypothetical protein HID58_018905 [Brassica napus]|uniref:Uncharacterized protein n=1 Tax=Brassica napus TaxID=3708 RepID=A0ABQ8DBC2_BRANA|nr:hypothetical protein HID58_018905 [Brassica napus]
MSILVPEEAIREAREKLREVMIQYVSGVEPSESDSRKERMRYAEENEETEGVIMNMALAATVSTEEAKKASEGQTSAERIPALARQGASQDQEPTLEADPARISVKKRLGRPPLNKNQFKPLGVNAGASTKNRLSPQSKYHLGGETLQLH